MDAEGPFVLRLLELLLRDQDRVDRDRDRARERGGAAVTHAVQRGGKLTGQLQISSRYDVEQFLARIRDSDAAPLSMLTGGLHLHTLCCPNEDAYTRACAALKAAGLLLGD